MGDNLDFSNTGVTPDFAGTNPDFSMAPPDFAGGGAVNLAGTFATRIINNQIFDSSLNGKGPVTITTYFLTNLTQAGAMVSTKATTCEVKLSPFKGASVTVTTTYPDSAVGAIIPQSNTVDLGSSKVGAPYKFHTVQNLSWNPSGNPETTPLPTKATDSQVVDADHDGHPGVTLQVVVTGLLNIMGDVYAINRSIVDVNATVLSQDRVQGPCITHQEQVVLDASKPTLKQQITAMPDDTKPSTFTMVRLTAAQASCAAIKAAGDPLFK